MSGSTITFSVDEYNQIIAENKQLREALEYCDMRLDDAESGLSWKHWVDVKDNVGLARKRIKQALGGEE